MRSPAPRLADLPADVRAIVAAAMAAERAAAVRDGSDYIRSGGSSPAGREPPDGGRASGATPSGPPRRRPKAAA